MTTEENNIIIRDLYIDLKEQDSKLAIGILRTDMDNPDNNYNYVCIIVNKYKLIRIYFDREFNIEIKDEIKNSINYRGCMNKEQVIKYLQEEGYLYKD